MTTQNVSPHPPLSSESAAQYVRAARRLLVLSGAGMSAESGIATFRGAQDSLWSQFDPAQLATVDAWQADPELVWGWYVSRMIKVRRARPHAGYHALAAIQRRSPSLRIVTQNVDDLHERVGLHGVIHLHGELFAHRCFDCSHPHDSFEIDDDIARLPSARVAPPRCVLCGGQVRPGVVWFGESLPKDALAEAEALARACDVALVVGTSGMVYPAAALPEIAKRSGATVIEINPEQTPLSALADVHLRMTASEGLHACLESAD